MSVCEGYTWRQAMGKKSGKEHPKVFISYSHDSAEHADKVLAFANKLRADGIDAIPATITPLGVLAQSEIPGPESLGPHASVPVHTPFTVNTDNTDQTVGGYNIFHMPPAGTDFTMLNTALVTDTQYVHTDVVEVGVHQYFVTAVLEDGSCEANSDTIEIGWPYVGIDDPGAGAIQIFPNPASDIVTIKSSYTINEIEVMSFIGQQVYTQRGVDSRTTKLNVSNLRSGVYFVKVTTSQGVRAAKITVTH